jgi:hypothetical protein
MLSAVPSDAADTWEVVPSDAADGWEVVTTTTVRLGQGGYEVR